MALDVEIPDPPSLHGPQPREDYESIDMTDQDLEDDYRREAIGMALQEGGWEDAFAEWARGTDLTAGDFEQVRERGWIDRFDFYWDPTTDDVGYRAPTVPDDAEGFTDRVDDVEAELDELGRVVSEYLENDYLRRDETEFGFYDEGTDEG